MATSMKKPRAADVGFAWPAFVSAAGDYVYVSDPVNRRVAVVKLDYSSTEEAAVPQP